MRKIRDVLRLRCSTGLSIRQIRASTKLSVGAIQKLLARADVLELGWPLPPDLTDEKLARLFYPGADTRVSRRFEVPDWSTIHQELKLIFYSGRSVSREKANKINGRILNSAQV